MKKLLNKKLVDEIIKGIKTFQIKSININNDIVDITNISNYTIQDLITSRIIVSNRYVEYLVNNGIVLSKVLTVLDNTNPHCYVLTNKGKYLSFNVTHHSAVALVKRFIYIYLISDLKFELGKKIEFIYETYFNDMCDILELNERNIGNNPIIHNLIKDILLYTNIHKLENTGRIRDEVAFTNRNNSHNSCNRYFTHPFLFIIENNILQTVELYSSSQDFRGLNKFTKEYNFRKIILKKLGRES